MSAGRAPDEQDATGPRQPWRVRMRYWDFEEDFDESVRAGMAFIGGLVREGRRRRNLTQRQLAWASTLTQSTISKLENGRLRGMRLRTLAAILGVLRVNPDGTASPRWHARSTEDEPARSHRRLPRSAHDVEDAA